MVEKPRVGLKLELSFFRDLSETRQMSAPGDLDLVKQKVAIIGAVVTKLVANITDLDTPERLMSFHVTNLHDERLNAVVVSKRYASGENDSMIRLDTQGAWPEFGSLDCGGVDGKSLSFLTVCCSGLKSGDIRTVSELCLRVAADHIEIIGQG